MSNPYDNWFAKQFADEKFLAEYLKCVDESTDLTEEAKEKYRKEALYLHERHKK